MLNFPTQLHHAYLITGDIEYIASQLEEYFQKTFNIVRTANPDFVVFESTTLSIDDARKLKEIHSSKPFASIEKGGRRIFLIQTHQIPIEAQNALLKLFEEPEPGNYFFIVMPHAHMLLPTLQSRVHSMVVEKNEEIEGKNMKKGNQWGILTKKFHSSTPAQRVEIVAGLMKEYEQEQYTRSDFVSFIDELIRMIRNEALSINKGDMFEKKTIEQCEILLQIRKYMFDRGSSPKMLLEYLAVAL